MIATARRLLGAPRKARREHAKASLSSYMSAAAAAERAIARATGNV